MHETKLSMEYWPGSLKPPNGVTLSVAGAYGCILVPGQMTHFVASLIFDSAKSCVMQGVSLGPEFLLVLSVFAMLAACASRAAATLSVISCRMAAWVIAGAADVDVLLGGILSTRYRNKESINDIVISRSRLMKIIIQKDLVIHSLILHDITEKIWNLRLPEIDTGMNDPIGGLVFLDSSRTGSLPSGRNPTDEDGDIGMGDPAGVSMSLGDEISSGGLGKVCTPRNGFKTFFPSCVLASKLLIPSSLFFLGRPCSDLKLHLSGDEFLMRYGKSGSISWRNLKSLCITRGKLKEGLVQNILSGRPVLETLELRDYYGFRQIDIASKSVKNLVLYGFSNLGDEIVDVIEINAPSILALTIQKGLLLWKVVLLNVSLLVEVELDYTKDGVFVTSPKDEEEELLKGLILSHRHVKKLKLGIFCSKMVPIACLKLIHGVLSHLEANGFTVPSNMKYLDIL
ncbi:F-box protein-like protein [Tanacetum coccineum]|uniref:F-box protein-like protein n=1 Tax=Tanacetum coccineum TaxID=301880 RepID=A0ABQ5IAW3_9ASTR